jgi:hypothetical protein
MTSTLPKGTLGSVASLLAVILNQGEILIGTTSSEISYHLKDIYSICRCCWNVATYKWKVHNLVDPYGISVSQMTTDMFHWSKTLPGPFLIHDLLPAGGTSEAGTA